MKQDKSKRQTLASDAWYIPSPYLASVRAVFGPERGIGLDPFSSYFVNAQEYSAFERAWDCETLFMNPPYDRHLITKAVDKFVMEWDYDRIGEAIVLVNNATETRWFQQMFRRCSAICLVDHRIKFMSTDDNARGQVFLYFGQNLQAFAESFNQHGATLPHGSSSFFG